jgi:nucleotide-binding universal stress UspA family protein
MKILVATDGSDYSKAAIYALVNVVANPETTAFKIVSSVEFPTMLPTNGFIGASAEYYGEIEKAGHEQAKESAEHAETQIRSLFPNAALDIKAEVLDGSPQRVIVETAQEWGADLIVVGSHGYGFWGRTLIGSVSDSVIHHAPCSVLVVRKTERETSSNIDLTKIDLTNIT